MHTQSCRLWSCLLLLGVGCSESAHFDRIAASADMPTKENAKQGITGESPSSVVPDSPAAVTDESTDRNSGTDVIAKGMTRSQVEALLKSQIDRAATVYWPGSAPIDRYYFFTDGRIMKVHFVLKNMHVRAVSHISFPLREEQVPQWAEFDKPEAHGKIW